MPKSILMLRHSAGYEHSYLPDAEVAIKQIGLAEGWKVTTTHLLQKVTAESLADTDLLIFATTGNLAFDEGQKRAIISYVEKGGAFLGIHNATDTGYDWPEYGEMMGGYFDGHPWHQQVGILVEDTDHPATRMLGDRFEVVDEIYTFKQWDRGKTHVLMRIDNDTVDTTKAQREDDDYAVGWCHDFGAGRVIYTALGHPEDLWAQSWFRQHIRGCMVWALNEES
ncbi:MAG: ThuA domain-containing protein [Candidatus Latescibacterota bacterium]|nr:ThuA domain-containing protein [Candidatus Latescibacterota bacterium]